MMKGLALFALLALLAAPALSFERSKFKKCTDSGFCRRQRARVAGTSSHRLLDPTPTVVSPRTVSFRLGLDEANVPENVRAHPVSPSGSGGFLTLTLTAGKAGELRLVITEDGIDRYRTRDVVAPEYDAGGPSPQAWAHGEPTLEASPSPDGSGAIYTALSVNAAGSGAYEARLYHDPLALVVYSPATGSPVVALNGRGLLNFEVRRAKSDAAVAGGDPDSLFSESFGGNTDSKPRGPESVGLDVSFIGADNVYGIPERAKSFALPPTVSAEPYRLYNLDVFEYEHDHEFGLYGSVPVMYAHSTKGTAGIFWNNPSETWIDVGTREADRADGAFALGGGGGGGGGGGRSGDAFRKRIDTHWASESGVIDISVFPGPSPRDVFGALSRLTGPAQLPPMFSLGYHQCRWNYRDEQDVSEVNAGFDEHQMPMDVLWLDIEHTDGKRYFTWDSHKFPTPERMQDELAEAGRKMVTIVDPHIKRDPNYHVHSEATSLGMYVKKPDGGDFEGHCWPGSSSYIDYTQGRVREWWAKLFAKYPGATRHLYTWVDMQEPSVFGSPSGAPEVTMPKDMVHLDGAEHRDVHNTYGMYCQMAAYEGNLKLRSDQDRPFVLARAFFAGSQRWGAVWTGDNTAAWSHLKASTPMLLSLGVSGITFSGADVGGFFGNPDSELLVRWYQAAAYQPFFRGHAHIDTKRREPWLFGEPPTGLIREALAARYAILPYLYTLFHEAAVHGAPVMRPLWFEFPLDRTTFGSDDSFMLGPALLVHPVVSAGAETSEVYLPSGPRPLRTVWYDLESREAYEAGDHVVSSPLRKTPVFLRGGHILARRERRRRSSQLMRGDPYTLVVALDTAGLSKGSVYVDDGETMAHKRGDWALTSIAMSDLGTLTARTDGSYSGAASRVERIVILGTPCPTKCGDAKKRGAPRSVAIKGASDRNVEFIHDPSDGSITVRDPQVQIPGDWEISVTY